MTLAHRPLLLAIMDGVGYTTQVEGNAVLAAETPTMDALAAERPQSLLRTDGEFVGLPTGQMGNSEVGHITIGAGRIIRQSLDRITHDLETGAFSEMSTWTRFLEGATGAGAVHLIGLFSDGGVHSHMDHALRMARLLDGLGVPVFVHAIGDGRDVGMKSGAGFAREFSASLEGLSHVNLATVIGRHFGMDRDNRWDRTGAAWRLLVDGEGVEHATVEAAYEATYAAGDYDEYVPASKTGADARIKDGDAVILFNFRADRMRQLARCFLGMEVGFEHSTPALRALATMTSYDEEYSAPNLHVLYPPEDHRNTFGEIVSNLGLRQLRIAETEKFPHVTFFFNAGKDEPWAGEDRILVNSPKDVRSYDLKPEMSLPEVTSRLLEAIEGGAYDLIVLNMANGDLVGHCGIMEASVKAVEAVDHALSLILPAVLKAGGEAVVFADHGNCEEMIVNGQPSTAHSTNPVLCTYVGPRSLLLRPGGLADIAPTALDLMGIEVPAEMSGESLIQ